MKLTPRARRRGKIVERDVVNAKHPRHGVGRYEVKWDGSPNFSRPVYFEDDNDDPNDGSGVWRYL